MSYPSRGRSRTRRCGSRAASPTTIQLAASKGIGALSFAFLDPSQAKDIVDGYYDTLTSGTIEPAGFAVNANVAIVLPLMCHEDEQTALDRGFEGSQFFGYALGHFYVFGTQQPGVTDIWDELQEQQHHRLRRHRLAARRPGPRRRGGDRERGEDLLRGAIGTPDRVREVLGRYEAAGVDQVIFLAQAGRTKHEHICESLELFAREVMPEFVRA